MNTTSLKSFAPAVRLQLMEAVTRKLDYVLSADTPDLRQLTDQVTALRREAAKDRKGLVERVAYTWFNRLAALRFLDARGWHPFRARVLTAATAEETQPELLKLMRSASLPVELHPHTDVQRLNDLLDQRLPTAIAGADPQGEVYRHLVLAVCHLYHALLPDLFERVNDETELLLPDDLLTATSVVEGFRTEITDEDCAEVEVLGWLYQFYISEKKDAVMARKSAVPTEDIPAVTQLFTPHWIVRYLVENSLGRLWLKNRPGSSLRQHMPYYIEDAAPEPPPFQAKWTAHIPTQSEGDFQTFLWLRPNAELKGDAESVIHYALTIDGYAYAQQVWNIENPSSGGASDKLASMIQDGRIIGAFEDLRAALFLWQRATKWGEDAESFRYFDLCYEALCAAWDTEWRNNERLLPDLAKHGIRLPEAAAIDFLRVTRPEQIKLVDPAVGSGHMLTYAFDLLYHIYEEEGHAPSEIPALILRHNLHGLEICPRAAQLAELALIFKARDKSRRFFQPEHIVRPNIIELKEIRFEENELRDYIQALGLGDLFNQPLVRLLHQFEEAKNFGSLIQPCLDERSIAEVRQAIAGRDLGGQLFLRGTHQKVMRVLEQAEALTQRYNVAVANPPYMGRGNMNKQLRCFTDTHFPESKADLMTCFMSRCASLAISAGPIAIINLPSWLFLKSFEKLRIKLLNTQSIESLLHLGRGIFGSDFGTVAFIITNKLPKNSIGVYRRLFERAGDVDTSEAKEQAFLNPSVGRFETRQDAFQELPGCPIAYWISARMRQCFQYGTPLGDFADVKIGMRTGDNTRFLRRWTEVDKKRMGLRFKTAIEAIASGRKWFPYNKGGEYRRWYGNNELVVNWLDNGEEIKDNTRAVYPQLGDNLGWKISNESYYFRSSLTWTATSISYFGIRHSDSGFLFDVKGSSCFTKKKDHFLVLGLLSSRLVSDMLACLNPTIEFQTGNIATIPMVAEVTKSTFKLLATTNAKEAVDLARADWDNFETSWDFRDQPLLRSELKDRTLESSWRKWEAQSTDAIRRMQELETKNNQLFIVAYGLEGELQPEVPEEQITLARADTRRDVAAFLSYAIGCMMGRYSLDQPGLILADAGDSLPEYLAKVGRRTAELDPQMALDQPDSLVVDLSNLCSCYAGGEVIAVKDAVFVLAEHEHANPGHIQGRPMIYCEACADARKDITRLRLPLPQFSMTQALRQEWADPDALIQVLKKAGFRHRIPAEPADLTFTPDEDGIVPVLDGEWFEDDIVARTREFLRATFGEETLNDNLRFIEQSLGKPLDKYFLTDFYKDHLQTYKKRPIYWLFQSPKKGFSALVYLHRYTKDTCNTLLNKYLRDYLHKLENRIAHLAHVEATATKTTEKTSARREADKLKKALKDCQDWERDTLLPLAQKRLEIDLDDGVKVNYLKFGDALAPIAGLAAKEDE